MRQYSPTINGRPIDTIPFVKANELGAAREHIFFLNGKQVKGKPQDRVTEMFCTYEKDGYSIKHFWLTRTERINEFCSKLFQDSRFNQHIHFIEWKDRICCVVGDGIYISQTYFFMTKEEFTRFMLTITPFERETPSVKKPCIGCVYFAACGSTTRTEPCKGRITKSRKAKEI